MMDIWTLNRPQRARSAFQDARTQWEGINQDGPSSDPDSASTWISDFRDPGLWVNKIQLFKPPSQRSFAVGPSRLMGSLLRIAPALRSPRDGGGEQMPRKLGLPGLPSMLSLGLPHSLASSCRNISLALFKRKGGSIRSQEMWNGLYLKTKPLCWLNSKQLLPSPLPGWPFHIN